MAELTGRELDVAMAKMLGCTPTRKDGKWDWQCTCDGRAHVTKHVDDEQGDWYELAHYSDMDGDAFVALDAMLAKRPGWGYEVSSTDGKKHQCLFFDGEQMCRADCGLDRPTRAKAICRALLKLVEEENDVSLDS